MHDEQHDVNTASVVEHFIASEHLEQTNSNMDNSATTEEGHTQADLHAHSQSIEPGTYEQIEATSPEIPTEAPIDKGETEISLDKEEAETRAAEVAHPSEQQENAVIATSSDIPPVAEEQLQEAPTVHVPVIIEEPVAVEPLLAEIPAETTEVAPVIEENNARPLVEALPLIEAEPEEVRPFTSFIEEFHLAEAARIQGSQSDAFSLLAGTPAMYDNSEQTVSPTVLDTGGAIGALIDAAGTVDATEDVLPETVLHDVLQDETLTPMQESVTQAPPTPTPVERPVSPLLRPATRLRLPRHGLHRQHDETVQPAAATQATQQQTDETPPDQAVPSVQPVASTEAGTEPGQSRPARRYRFDRPSNANGNITPITQPTQPAVAPHYEENKEKGGATPLASAARVENGQGNNGATSETQPKQTTNDNQNLPAQSLEQPVTQEPAVIESSSTTTSHSSEPEHRRRHGQERLREKEQPVIQQPVVMTNTPTTVANVAALIEQEVAATGEVAPEDLPPLEYAELQKANSRRRRRHRPTSGGTNATPTPTPPIASTPTKVAVVSAAPAPPTASVVPTPEQPAAQVLPPVTTATAPRTIGNPTQYTIVSGYTVGQMNQGNDVPGPFMGPEPSPARGSVITRDGRNIRAEAQRTPVYPVRTGDGTVSGTSVQQLASVLSQAIQTQTDRMVAELRRANQSPTSVSVTMPPFPSTERVGVFVDVANLLYSARTLRIAVDFGKLLDFLRGNRRLVRAHAYCPTSPQAGDEQMFLQAVKGLGYRITTKNYKTFSSGAKKADLDLDLCMDVVRLVDGRAVDCVVLVSGDSDFMPMLDYCSDHGVRVEVAAFDEAMSATLRQSCDLFINLSMLEEIRS